MVRTRARAEPPAQLLRQPAKWTARYRAILDGTKKGDWGTRGAKKALSSALRELAHGKCVYCESALDVTVDLEVDHYIAKTIRPDLAFEWTNLLPSCRLCNRPKLNHDHANSLLKPDIEDPEPFFWIHPDTGRLEPHPTLDAAGKHRADETIGLCGLQRAALCTRRIDTMNRVNHWLEQVASHGLNRTLREEWEWLSDPRSEYKFVLRHVLGMKGLKTLADEDRRRFHG